MNLVFRAIVRSAALFAMAASSSAHADYCITKPTAIIIHTDQSVYFTADPVCIGWCRLPPGWGENQKDRAVALITTAISQKRPLTPFFSGPCVRQQVFAEPESIQMVAD
jgi:hypothetical protein